MEKIRYTVVLAGIIFLFLSGPATGQTVQEFEEWHPDHMIQLPSVSSPAVSSDGSMVAYVTRKTLMDGEKSEFLSHIWVAKTDGSMNRQYTRGDKSASNPSFTPDGNYLSFISSRNEKTQVYRMHLDGGEAEQVTFAENGVGSYKWSPDGNRIAYTMTDPKSEEEKKREKEKRDVILVDKDHKFSRLYVQAIGNLDDEPEAIQIFSDDLHVTSFDWSPDGETIVFSHWPTPKINDRYYSDISIAPADSGNISTIVDWDGDDSSPHFSADGSFIVFTSSGGTKEPVGLSDVYRVDVTGGTPQALAKTFDRNASIVGWTSDNRNLLISESRKTVSALYRLPLNGNDPVLITPEDGIYRGFEVNSEGGRVVFTFETPSMPAEVYVSELSGFSKNKISAVYDEFSFPEFGKTELLSWTSPDGTPVEGLLTYPVGYEAGDLVPLILNVHGGPAGVYSQTFTGSGSIYSIQYFAENGYALLRPNPRGSTGYGKEFRYANVQDWGFGDYEDLMSGVDHVIDMGVADPDSLVEMGWSYGGYMTSFIVTRTQRFKAVSMGAGLPNLISMVGTTDIPDYLTAHMDGLYWEEGLMEVYERHSAQYHIDQIETPVQIIHGQQDFRVPLAQGQEFYWALSEKGVPTEMIIYPRTPHGPREPKFIADVSVRIMEWFDHHLNR